MNVNYETLYDEIVTTHDIDTLKQLRRYNDNINDLFYSLIIEQTDKPIFECCREFLNYLKQIEYVIEEQITYTLDDMERCQPADEED